MPLLILPILGVIVMCLVIPPLARSANRDLQATARRVWAEGFEAGVVSITSPSVTTATASITAVTTDLQPAITSG